jgi:hypothetical protein
MIAKCPSNDPGPIREILVVAVLTLVGALLRVWSLGRLGLIHFDEGVYALAGFWIFSPNGLRDLNSQVISYAPPGFPILVGISYLFLGAVDGAAILVSIVSGALTIPAVGWLAYRTFGRGAGAVAAAFAAASGQHIAFSRMALTDTSFLLLWILALGQGQRFLERPNFPRAVVLGMSVGSTQLFKYNGWISGIIVALSAAPCWLIHHEARSKKAMIATWGWGLFAAGLAAVVYWPWFRFVESHGGYQALVAHHRSYLAGISSWPKHLTIQLAQARVLSGGPIWLAWGGLSAAMGLVITTEGFGIDRRLLPRVLLEASVLTLLCLIPDLGWWVGLLWISAIVIAGRRLATGSLVLLGVGWLFLAVFTPFYHPYARLWLPLQAFGWLFLGGWFVWFRSNFEVEGRRSAWRGDRSRTDPLPWISVICFSGALFQGLSPDSPWKSRFPSVLGPRDSVRQACRALTRTLPNGVEQLRIFARPAVTFYLASRAAVQPQPDLEHLLDSRNTSSWAILDTALLRQDPSSSRRLERFRSRWDWFETAPALLDIPTLLDIEPTSALSGRWDMEASLALLRPKRPGENR